MINVIIPAAGKGSRFVAAGVTIPKPLIHVDKKTLLEHSIDSLGISSGTYMIITRNFYNSNANDDITKIIKASEKAVFEIKTYESEHNGAAHTCLMAEKTFQDNEWMDQPLIVTNCDQLLLWDVNLFLDFLNKNDPDGAIVLFKSDNPKNSFADIQNGKVVRVVEKQVISDAALIGVHYWKKAKYFFDSAKKLEERMSENFIEKERYVSETYNFLIEEGKIVLPYFIPNDEFIPLGTPEDVDKYISFIMKKQYFPLAD